MPVQPCWTKGSCPCPNVFHKTSRRRTRHVQPLRLSVCPPTATVARPGDMERSWQGVGRWSRVVTRWHPCQSLEYSLVHNVVSTCQSLKVSASCCSVLLTSQPSIPRSGKFSLSLVRHQLLIYPVTKFYRNGLTYLSRKDVKLVSDEGEVILNALLFICVLGRPASQPVLRDVSYHVSSWCVII